MKFDMAMSHVDYAKHSGFHVSDSVTAIRAAFKRLGGRVFQALQARDYGEEFLNRSQNLADLERRMQILMSPDRGHGPWQD